MSFDIQIPSHIHRALECAPLRVQSRVRIHLSAAAVLAARTPPPDPEWLRLLYGVKERELTCEVDNFRLHYTFDLENRVLRVVALVERRGGNELVLREGAHAPGSNGNGRGDPSSGSEAGR